MKKMLIGFGYGFQLVGWGVAAYCAYIPLAILTLYAQGFVHRAILADINAGGLFFGTSSGLEPEWLQASIRELDAMLDSHVDSFISVDMLAWVVIALLCIKAGEVLLSCARSLETRSDIEIKYQGIRHFE